jgi:hypothetical protein
MGLVLGRQISRLGNWAGLAVGAPSCVRALGACAILRQSAVGRRVFLPVPFTLHIESIKIMCLMLRSQVWCQSILLCGPILELEQLCMPTWLLTFLRGPVDWRRLTWVCLGRLQ